MEDIEKIILKGVMSSKLGVVVANSKREIIKVNDRFTELFKYGEEDVLGKNCSILQGEKTDQEDVQKLRDSLNKLEPHETILLNYDSEGKEIWNKIQINPISYKDEIYFVGVQSDVTEKFNQLIEATKGTRTIIHDIKNTFANIIGFIDLIKLENPTKDLDEYLNQMYVSIRNSNHLIQDSLINELHSSGRLKPEYAKINISKLLEETTKFYSLKHKNSKIKFTSNITPDVKKFTDERIINTILHNYISNSEKHTDSGEINLSLEEKENSYIISVKDTGKGIKEEDKPFIFKDNFTTNGYGIGLDTCKKLAEIINGELSFKSEYGKGSCFYAEFKNKNNNLV